jgi:di/tricarboxylate transporter
MSTESINLTIAGSRKRRAKDRLASVGVTTGGILVLVALLLIFSAFPFCNTDRHCPRKPMLSTDIY